MAEDDSMVIDQEEKTTGKLSYDEKLQFIAPIAKPIASKKLAKRLYKLMKSAHSHKTYLRIGLKEVQSKIRRGETGIAIFAGNITPIEIMCHMPIVCEDKNIPYVYVPSSEDLGNALGYKRSIAMALVRYHEDYKELYEKCKKEINALPPPF